MKKLSVAARIFLIYASALGILFLFSILALYFALQLRETPEQIVKENVYSLEAAIHLKRQIFHQKKNPGYPKQGLLPIPRKRRIYFRSFHCFMKK